MSMPLIKAQAKLIENVRSIADNSKQHSIVLDLPESSGGDNTGPTALELAIMSLADCAVTIFADVAKKSDVTLDVLEVTAVADKPADSPTPSKVQLHVTVKSAERDQKLQALWRRTEANCPVVKIFTEPIPIEVTFVTS
jgi:putative redox protein